MERHLQREINNLKARLLAMSAVVEKRVADATRSIADRDPELAQSIMKGDYEIDELEVGIEEECLKILALHQPVAIDLRFIIAVLKINSDLERVGDLAVNIAERGAFLATQEQLCMPFNFVSMATRVQDMLGNSIKALVNLDTRLAHHIRAEDDEIDAINRQMYEMVKTQLTANPERTNCLLHSLSVCRHLERIADHATNIAEDVIYLAEAQIVRHTPETFTEE
ncbi:MAG: phosphate transport system regulatory protein PhoU [Desulfobacterales bacterium CG2_30_60_27]|nr:MAG: phosphate transport system regulatory protein PhoU [Desulfobacterales bacterium CG2_30_60_27]